MNESSHTEALFERTIAEHLCAHGYYPGSPDDFDQKICLFTEVRR